MSLSGARFYDYTHDRSNSAFPNAISKECSAE
ncbi:hypothetical protein CCACVL1_21504 [Corchorus capsularis]|uniref:Uncharacterized protein n=1 Tax=Corchorus capsularis TaxID=210143 RepID=A0A1R3H5R0_COCAP|nr:hypothetical protein CCACVL1_21504 [Corchorus capsularis]